MRAKIEVQEIGRVGLPKLNAESIYVEGRWAYLDSHLIALLVEEINLSEKQMTDLADVIQNFYTEIRLDFRFRLGQMLPQLV